jgi:hypothetical protein
MKIVASDGKEYAIIKPETSLGREATNDIQLKDSKVSAKHAMIHLAGDDLTLEDLNSTNGSFINEAQLRGSRPLRAGDQIRLGDTIFTVRSDFDMEGTQIDTTRAVAMPKLGTQAAPAAPPVAVAAAAPAQVSLAGSEMTVFQGMAIAGMILGILSIPLNLTGWLCPGVLGLLGLILSAIGLKTSKGRAMAIAGLVTSIIGLLIAGVILLLNLIHLSGLRAGFPLFG